MTYDFDTEKVIGWYDWYGDVATIKFNELQEEEKREYGNRISGQKSISINIEGVYVDMFFDIVNLYKHEIEEKSNLIEREEHRIDTARRSIISLDKMRSEYIKLLYGTKE